MLIRQEYKWAFICLGFQTCIVIWLRLSFCFPTLCYFLLKTKCKNCVLIPDKYWSLKSQHWYIHPVLEKLKANIISFVIKQETERLIMAKIKLLSKRLAAAYSILPKIKNLKHLFWTWLLRTRTKSEQFLLESFLNTKQSIYSQFCCFHEHLPNYSALDFNHSVTSLFFNCHSQPR